MNIGVELPIDRVLINHSQMSPLPGQE